jgi:hypothetical protein
MTDLRLTRSDLSPDQRQVYESMLDWTKTPSSPLLTVSGFAGTGKSTLLGLFAAETDLKIAYLCFTGRASSVLNRKLNSAGIATTNRACTDDESKLDGHWGHMFYSPLDEEARRPFCGTIHRMLYRPFINSVTEELMGWEKRTELDRGYDLIVVDECFHHRQYVLTENGRKQIGAIVNERDPCRVWSLNKQTGALELKPVVRWLKKPAPETLLKIDASRTNSQRSARVMKVTPKHKILTPSGYKLAGCLKPGDEVSVRGRHLTSLQFSVLVGSMLGDASMGRSASRNSPQPMFTQGEEQLEWLRFKKSIFGEDMTGDLQKGSSGYGEKDVWRFALNVTDQARRVTEQMPHVALKNKRRWWAPTEKFLSWVDEIALAVWFLDNGSVSRAPNGNLSAFLHTQRFDQEVNENLATFLLSRFDVKASVGADGRGYYFLRFGQKETVKLLDIIRPFSPKCMEYKISGASFDPPFVPAGEVTVALVRSIKSVTGNSKSCRHVYDLEVADNHNYIAGNIVVSNCSMVTDETLLDLSSHGVRIMAVGDHGQLPPVMGTSSLMRKPMLRLEKIHRQAEGSPIIQLSRVLREEGRLARELADGQQVRFGSARELGGKPLADMLWHNKLDAAVLCWRNATRVHVNRTIREHLGFAGKMPQIGEPLIALKNYPPVYNGMRGLVTEEATCPLPEAWWLMKTKLEFPDEGLPATFQEICRDQFHRARPFESVDELKSVGIQANTMGDAGRLFDFGFAMTIHKSQGSQFKHAVVVVDWKQDYSNENTKRLAYTAITRASERLTCLT